MNTLSWLIYLAGVVGDIKGLFILTSFIGALAIVGYIIIYVASYEKKPPHLIKLICLVFGLATFASLLPGERTVYAIAASEMGEVVVKSEEAQEVFKALKERVMDELKIEEKKD